MIIKIGIVQESEQIKFKKKKSLQRAIQKEHL